MSVKISLSGNVELDRVFKGLPKVLQSNILTNAHVAAAKPLVTSIKALVPVGQTGNLKRSIGIERLGKLGGDSGAIQVGPRRKGGFRGYHGHLIEYGKTNRDGRRSRAYPFMEMSFNARKGEVEKNIAFQVGLKVAQFINQNVKR